LTHTVAYVPAAVRPNQSACCDSCDSSPQLMLLLLQPHQLLIWYRLTSVKKRHHY